MANDHVAHTNITNTAIDPKSVLVENVTNSVNGPTSQQPSDSNIYARASNSPPMAVLPLNPSAKLDQEPNPFEQSFSSASKTSPDPEKAKQHTKSTTATMASNNNVSINSNHSLAATSTSHPTSNEPLKLPPVAAMTSPAVPNSVMSSVPKDIASQYAWDSLRTGPLSPSMLQRPTNPDDSAYSNINPSSLLSYPGVSSNSYQVKNDSYYQQHERSQLTSTKPKSIQKSTKKPTTNKKNANTSVPPPTIIPTSTNRRRKLQPEDDDNDNDDDEEEEEEEEDNNSQQNSNDGEGSSNKKPRTDEEDEKRKNFLERNRLAALKCRQRKKQWLNNLQAKVEYLTNDNEQLQIQANALREEIVNLKTLLLAHKDCPISQTSGFPSNMNPKGMGSQQQQQQQQQQSLIHRGGGVPNSGPVTSVSATTTPVSMGSMYTQQQQYNTSHRSQPQLPHPHPHPHSHPHPHPHQHRMSTSSTGSQPPSGLNMVMVSQHQGTAPPQPSSIQPSSGVIQF